MKFIPTNMPSAKVTSPGWIQTPTWVGAVVPGKYQPIFKVNVRFINVGMGYFRSMNTGLNGSFHVAKGLYNIISLQMSEYSCVVVMLP